MSDKDINQLVWLYGLRNAVKFNGQANPGAVIGKIRQEFKTPDIEEIKKIVSEVIEKVNQMTME